MKNKKYILCFFIIAVVTGYLSFKIVSYNRLEGIIFSNDNVKSFGNSIVIRAYPNLRCQIINNKKDSIIGIRKIYENNDSKYILIQQNISKNKVDIELALNGINMFPLGLKISSDDRFVSFIDDNYLYLVDLKNKTIEKKVELYHNIYDWLDGVNILFSDGGYLKVYNILSETTDNFDDVFRGDMISLSADKKNVMYSKNKDEVKVENLITGDVKTFEINKDASDFTLSPNGKHIAYLTPKLFSKFEKNLVIIDINGSKIYKQSNWKQINEWK